ncbi:MAG: hypothetical protein AAGK37_17815 [Pseudomonadota bacterium]
MARNETSALRLVFERNRDRVQKELEFDPRNPDFIGVLSATHDGFGQTLTVQPTRAERVELVHQALALKSFDPDLWEEAGRLVREMAFDEDWHLDDVFVAYPYYVNAAVYRNNDLTRFLNIERMFRDLVPGRDQIMTGQDIPPEVLTKLRETRMATMPVTDLICPMIRARRVALALCGQVMEEGASCDYESLADQAGRAIVRNAEKHGICRFEFDTPLEDLVYCPLQAAARPAARDAF